MYWQEIYRRESVKLGADFLAYHKFGRILDTLNKSKLNWIEGGIRREVSVCMMNLFGA
jgi:hypothetical protein